MISTALNNIGRFRDNELALFEQSVSYRLIKKDNYLLKAGAVCQSVFFCKSGAVLQYNFKNEIDLNVIDLHVEGDWILNHRSFSSQTPSEFFTQAYIDTEVFELSIESLHHLISVSPSFLQLGKILDLSSNRVIFFDDSMDPLEKYKYVLEHRPQILQKFPLKLIASYLKISPETLSRVRERVAKNGSRI